MTRTALLSRPAGLALCLLAVSATGGCTRFRYAVAHPSAAAAERAEREQAASQPAALPPPPAPVQQAPMRPAQPPAAPSPATPPAPEPVVPAAPAQTAPAQPTGPSAADQRKARANARKAEQEAAKQAHAQEKAERHAKVKEQAQAPAPAREPVFAQAAAPVPVPVATPAPVETAPAADTPALAPVAPSVDAPVGAPVSNAIIMFSNTPGAHCTACDTIKISVASSGKVLIERGYWTGTNRDWRYRKSVAHVAPARAAAFAARVNGYRPTGDKALGSCPASSSDGLLVEWIAAERHDRLTVTFACSDARAADALRHAPDLLGLRQLDFAWGTR